MAVWLFAASAATGSVVTALGALLAHRLLQYRRETPEIERDIEPLGSSSDHGSEVSLGRYQAMNRLLSGEDLRYLANRPGYRPELGARLRRSYRRVFRMYLRELTADFQALHRSARHILADAPEEHSELVATLIGIQVRFWGALAGIELRLMLDWAGVGTADAGSLLQVVEALRESLQRASGPRTISAF